jgi:glycosyltransferase involved in cell wall biosynthesis
MGIRVGFFLPHFNAGGIEKIVLNLLQRLDRARFEPVLILGARHGTLLGQLPPDVAVADLDGVPMRRVPGSLGRLLRRLGCGVVYSGTNAANLALLATTATMARPPRCMISEHTSARLFLREAKWPALRRLAMRVLYRRADAIAVPYAPLGAELCATLGAPGLRVVEILNPVLDDAAIGAAAGAAGDGAAGPCFVAAGRLEPVKGFDLLLDAFARFAAERPDVRLAILGEGGERAALEAQAQALGIAARVAMPGYVADPARWFAQAAGLVLSSRREGTPNVVVEAMAAGAPVIVSDCSDGPRWLVGDGAAGLVADPRDPAALAGAMGRLLDEPDLARRLREAGFARARRFTYAATLPAFEDAIAALA